MVVQHRFPLLLRKLDPETSISTPVPTRLFHRGSDYSHPRNLYSHARNPYSHPPGISIHIAPESVFTCPGIRTIHCKKQSSWWKDLRRRTRQTTPGQGLCRRKNQIVVKFTGFYPWNPPTEIFGVRAVRSSTAGGKRDALIAQTGPLPAALRHRTIHCWANPSAASVSRSCLSAPSRSKRATSKSAMI